MSLAQVSNYPKTKQLSWRFRDAMPLNVSLRLEHNARELRGATALVLPYSESRTSASQFLSIDFRDLVIEQNAWVNFLINRGVKQGDTAVVWLPLSPSLVSICYALFKIGAHAIVLDPEFDWKSGGAALRSHVIQHQIGTRSALAYLKSLPRDAETEVNRVEVVNPHGLVGSAIRSFQMRSMAWDRGEATLTLLRTRGHRCSQSRFDQGQLCHLASLYTDWFDLNEGDRCLPGSLLECLLYPAAGLASVLVSERFSDGSPYSIRAALEAAAMYGLNLVSGELRFWRGVAASAGVKASLPTLEFDAILLGDDFSNCNLNTLNSVLPDVAFAFVFGSLSNPFIASKKPGETAAGQGGGEGPRGLYVGKPLPGLQVSLLPSEGLRWADEPGAATPLGEIAVAKQDYAPLGDRGCWEGVGELGFFDGSGGLWRCGGKEDVLGTSFGGFCPVRCETVFNRHPRVKRSALIALRKNGKTRPGLVVETALGDIPRRGIEESRFKAELLQLAMNIEETSLIMDIFFSDQLPLEEDGFEGIDRRRLSKEYSRRIRY